MQALDKVALAVAPMVVMGANQNARVCMRLFNGGVIDDEYGKFIRWVLALGPAKQRLGLRLHLLGVQIRAA